MVVNHERRDENAAHTPYSLPAYRLLSAYVRAAFCLRLEAPPSRSATQFPIRRSTPLPLLSCLPSRRNNTTLRPPPRVFHCDTPGRSAPFTMKQQHSAPENTIIARACLAGTCLTGACRRHAALALFSVAPPMPHPAVLVLSLPLPSASRRNRRHPPSYYLVLVRGAAARRSPRADPGCAPAGVQRRECGGRGDKWRLIAFHARW